jgi:hypothetical protein
MSQHQANTQATADSSSGVIQHASNAELTSAGQAVKAILDIKFSRAKERHAAAMGFASSNHLLAALKVGPIQKEFDQYIEVLRVQAQEKHQISLSAEAIESLRQALVG